MKCVLLLLALCALSQGQLLTRTRTRTTTTTTRSSSSGLSGTRQITLAGGQILNIDSRTLTRLQRQGVDINNLQNLSEEQLEELGISLRADTLTIPGASINADGLQTVTLRNGIILTIDEATLARLRAAGIRLDQIQNLTEAELRRIGITLSTETLEVALAPGSTRTITLADGTVITVVYEQLVELQRQGIDIDNLQALSERDLRRLGLIQVTRTVTTTRARLTPGSTRTIRLTDGTVITVVYEQLVELQRQGIDIDNLQALSENDLERLGLISVTRTVTTTTARARPTTTNTATRTRVTASLIPTAAAPLPAPVPRARARPRPQATPVLPPPPPRAPEGDEEAEPAPEPFAFEYTADTEDGASTTHQAQQTAEGVVTGFYIIKEPNGNQRRVDYIADKDGYRATISTNEIGTESKNPANVEIQSSAPLASELSQQFTAEQERLGARRQQPATATFTNSRRFDQRRTALASNLSPSQRPVRIIAADAEYESESSAPAASGIKI